MSENRRDEAQYLIWLETRVDVDNEELKSDLSKTYHNFQVYEEPNGCVHFVSDLPKDRCCVFLILAGIHEEYLAEMIIDLPQIANIYLYDPKKTKEELLLSDRKHIRFSTNNSKDLLYVIARDIELKEGILPALSVFTFDTTTFERSVRDLCPDHQSATFVWFQLLVDVIRQLAHTLNDKEEMIVFLREYFNGCNVEQEQLNQFVNEYNSTNAILWYTKAGFLFRVLNRALRTQNIDNIFKLRYFLQDLYNQMDSEYADQRGYLDAVTVYRGQLMYRDDFDALLKNSTSGNLIAFNSFLWTTYDEHAASIFAGAQTNTVIDEISVLFKIGLDFDKSKLPFAFIGHLSAVRTEEETLVAMGSVFRIDQIIENRGEKRWDVSLTLNKEVNERLSAMINHLKEEMGNESSLMVLGRFLGDMGDLYRAERYFRLLLNELPSDHPDLGTLLNNLGIIAHKQDQHRKAIQFCQRALQVFPKDHGDQSCAYANIGASYQAIGDDHQAIVAYQKAIELNFFPSDKAKIYNNIGSIYRHRRQYDKSIEHHQLSLELKSPNDPELVATHCNLSMTYADMQDYANSLVHCQHALDAIRILPIDSIRIGMAHFHVGFIKAKMEQHEAALRHFSNALNAYHQMTPSAVVTESIIKTLYRQGRSYMELEQNTSALACFNEILSTISTTNDRQDQVALVHHSIGQVYDNERSFRRALESYMLALNIWTILLKTNSKVDRHVIAQLLNDIAEIYERTKRYAYALWYYAQAIEFAQGDPMLVREYTDNFQTIASRSIDILREILNFHIIEFE